MAESVLRITIDSRNAERNARNVANELQNIERNGDHASRSMDSMSVATRSLVGYMGGLVTIGAAISKMDAYTGLQNRLKLVTDSQAELNTAMNDTFGIAQKTASSWDSVAMVYQRFADNADRLNITMAQTSALTETVSKAISVSGGSAASAEAALMQFGQALASGVLRGEEFNSIAEQAPGLLKAIAFGLNTNVGSLRAMAADGKITGDVLVDALGKAKPYIDDLFNRTDFTISQSFTKLSNEVTKFVGEAGKGSGAASALSDSIGFLAKNLSAIADIAIVGGVAMLTKTILAQTVAIQGSITASVARRAADTAVLQSQVQLAAIEVQRTRQIAAQAISEIGLARQELNSATTRTARAAATIRLTQAEIAHRIALNQTTAAIATNTAAQNALNASRAIGTRMLALVGGPIGAITLGVAGLAAGYMYLKNRTAEANAKLEEQGKIAEKTDEELKKLSGNDKVSATKDLTAAFAAQNATLEKSKESVNAVLFAIRAVSVENERARKITEDARKGVISYDEAIKLLNNEKIPTDLYDELKKQAGQYDENAVKASKSQKALNIFGVEVKLSGNAAQNAASQINQNTDALDDNARAANAASKAHQDYLSKAQSQAFDDIYTTGLIKEGRSPAQAKAILELQKAKGDSAILSKEEIDQALRNLALTDANAAAEKKYADRISNRSKTQSDAARKAKQAQEQARREAEQLRKEQYDLRESIYYEFADRAMQIEKDLQNKIADIQKANFSPEMTSGYIQNAKNRAELEKEIFISQVEFELNEFNLTEEAKLQKRHEINKLIIQANRELSNENRDIALQLSEQQYQQELGYIKLAKEQRIFQAEQAMYTEMELIQKRYAFELQEIAKVQDADERSRLLNAASFNKKESENDLTKSLTSDYMSVMGIEENPLIQQFEVLNKLRENDLINEEAYQNAKLQLQAKSTAGYMEGMLGGFASLVDENSKTYAVLFAAQKAFAVAQAMLNIPSAYSKAYDAVVGTPYIGPYIAPVVGAAAAALQVAQATQIKSTTMSGFKSGGYTGNYGVNQEAGVVHGQEYVLNAEATKRVGVNTLNAINNGGTLQAEKVAQANVKAQSVNPQPIESNVRVGIFDDRKDMMNQMYGKEGEKIVMYHLKRNGMLKP